jgi:hypothetical protein
MTWSLVLKKLNSLEDVVHVYIQWKKKGLDSPNIQVQSHGTLKIILCSPQSDIFNLLVP